MVEKKRKEEEAEKAKRERQAEINREKEEKKRKKKEEELAEVNEQGGPHETKAVGNSGFRQGRIQLLLEGERIEELTSP